MSLAAESFEGLTVTTNSPAASVDGFLRPGFVSDFDFASGVRLVVPSPNNADDGAFVGDFTISADATWGFIGNGQVTSIDVPDGTAYIGRNVESGGTLGFSFNTDVRTVGAFVDASDTSGISMAAYDAGGKLISGANIRSVPAADWDSNFIQVTSQVPIAKVVFTGDFLVLDKLIFDTDSFGVTGSRFNDKIDGTHSVNGAHATEAVDLILGKGGDDKIQALGGNDTVDGGKANDKLFGGDGNDTLIGGKGDDKLTGDAGQDSFLFRDLKSVDKLKDFNPVDDTVLLDHAKFTALPLGVVSPSQFHIGSHAADPDDRIVYDSNSGKLSLR